MSAVRAFSRLPVQVLATLAVIVLLPPSVFAEDVVWPARVEVVTDGTRPVKPFQALPTSVSVQFYDLSAPAKLEAELSEGLPLAPEEAAKEARRRIESLGHRALRKRFGDAYGGLTKAMEYGIDRYPAVVFDGGAAVVYGVTELATALRHYRAWRRRRDR